MRDDWVSTWWQAACLPEHWDICGVAVPALSVWHTFALENIDNRFLVGGVPDQDDAASLLLFATHNMRGGKRLMLHGNFRARAMRRVARAVGRISWVELNCACVDYVATCMRTVDRTEKQGAKGAACPSQWHIVHRLCRDYHMSLNEAWNTPYAFAHCLYDVTAENAGDDSLLSYNGQAHIDQMEGPS